MNQTVASDNLLSAWSVIDTDTPGLTTQNQTITDTTPITNTSIPGVGGGVTMESLQAGVLLGSWVVAPGYLYSGIGTAIAGLAPADYPFWAGAVYSNRANAAFRVTPDGALFASNATISGSIIATTGAIGGFNLGSDYIRDAANSFGLASTVTIGDDVRFWAGAAFADRTTAPIRIYESGAIVVTTLSITGQTTFTGSFSSSGSSLVNPTIAFLDIDLSVTPTMCLNSDMSQVIAMQNTGSPTSSMIRYRAYKNGNAFFQVGTVSLARNTQLLTQYSTTYIFGVPSADSTKVYRYDQDGTNEQLMTISGTGITAANQLGTDHTDLFVLEATQNTIRRYSVSGTTLTFVATITLSTPPTAVRGSFAVDATYIYMLDNTSGTNYYISRWTRAGAFIDTRQIAESLGNKSPLGVMRDPSGKIYIGVSQGTEFMKNLLLMDY